MVRMGLGLLVCPHGEQDGRSLGRANDQVTKHQVAKHFPPCVPFGQKHYQAGSPARPAAP